MKLRSQLRKLTAWGDIPTTTDATSSGKAFHDLPVEIVEDILLRASCTALETFGLVILDYSQVARLRVVCHFWNDLIEKAPGFWTLLTNRAPEKFTQICVKRTGNRVLDVLLKDSRSSRSFAKARFLNMILPSASRWRSLAVISTNPQEVLDLIMPLSTPKLISLQLDVPWRSLSPNPWKQEGHSIQGILNNATPAIRHIKLDHFYAPWSSSLFNASALTSLSVWDPLYDDEANIEDFYGALSASSGTLEYLSITMLFFSDTTKPERELTPLAFPQLRTLILDACSSEAVSCLMDMIQSTQPLELMDHVSIDMSTADPMSDARELIVSRPLLAMIAFINRISAHAESHAISVISVTYDLVSGGRRLEFQLLPDSRKDLRCRVKTTFVHRQWIDALKTAIYGMGMRLKHKAALVWKGELDQELIDLFTALLPNLGSFNLDVTCCSVRNPDLEYAWFVDWLVINQPLLESLKQTVVSRRDREDRWDGDWEALQGMRVHR